jgi:hypothetical protein
VVEEGKWKGRLWPCGGSKNIPNSTLASTSTNGPTPTQTIGDTYPVFSSVYSDDKAVMNTCRCKDDSQFSASDTECICDESPLESDRVIGCRGLLRRAERYLLQKRYKEALFAVNQAFVRMSKSHDKRLEKPRRKQEKELVLLSPTLRLPGRRHVFQFAVSLLEPTNQPDILDVSHQLAAIGLQSWHELSSRDRMEQGLYLPLGTGKTSTVRRHAWKHLEPTLTYFDIPQETSVETKLGTEENLPTVDLEQSFFRALSLDLMSVWIPFWEAHGYEKQSFGWATQILLVASSWIHSENGSENANVEKKMTKNEETIWLYYVCHQLPHIKDTEFALHMLQLISTTSDDGLRKNSSFGLPRTINELVERAWDSYGVHRDTIDQLVVTLKKLMTDVVEENKDELYVRLGGSIVSFEVLSKAHASLRNLLRKHDKKHNIQRRQRQPPTELTTARLDNLPQNGLQAPVSNGIVSIEESDRCIPSGYKFFLSLSTHVKIQGGRVLEWISRVLREGLWNIQTTSNIQDVRDNKVTLYRRRHIQTIALSLAFLIFSFRHRRLVERLGKIVVVALLEPIRELIDALLLPSQRAIGHDERTSQAG